MPSKSHIRVVCLWEHEVRLAAKAFANLSKIYEDEASTEDQRADALRNALNAGIAALAQADDDNAALVLSHAPGLGRPVGAPGAP